MLNPHHSNLPLIVNEIKTMDKALALSSERAPMGGNALISSHCYSWRMKINQIRQKDKIG